MVAPRYRSRTLARIKIVTPGHRHIVHYKKRKPAKAKCGKCGALLKGVPRERPYKMQNMAKTRKRPERPYGGVLCTRCMREMIVNKVRASSKPSEEPQAVEQTAEQQIS
jgi:large subunit ribosomal protein L34e